MAKTSREFEKAGEEFPTPVNMLINDLKNVCNCSRCL
jgi:hypothetical protein